MPKELFNQTVITSPSEPEDNDRLAFGQPSVSGGKNLLWSRFKEIIQGLFTSFDYVDFNPQSTNPPYQEGRMFYQDSEKTVSLFNDRSNTLRQLGRELGDRALNNTGGLIPNGTVVYVSGDNGTVRTVGLADASSEETALGTIGFATEDIPDGEIGEITFIGKVRDIDTTGCTVAEPIYLSTTPGQFTNFIPESPNYTVFLGNCGRVDASNGQIDAKVVPRNNTQSVIKIFNGAVLEDTTTVVSSNGATVTLSYEKTGGGDLSLFFNAGFVAFDSTPAATVALTPGTDSNPVLNYVYIPESTVTLTASTSGWPSGQHVPVATVLCQSATGVQTDGVYKMHAWTDHLAGSNEQGHLSHVNFWIRNQNATWLDGIVPTTTVVVNGGAIDNVYFSTTAGVAGVLQLHEHDFPVLNMQTGDPCWIINDFTTKYDRLLDLSSLDTDSEGVTLRSNNTYYSIVIMGIVSEDTADCKYMANAPSGSYSTSTGAINDTNGYSNYSIPTDFKGTAFLIARVVLRYQTSAGGTLTEELTEDLRGLTPSTSAGGGGSGGGGETFRIQSNTSNSIAEFGNSGADEFLTVTANSVLAMTVTEDGTTIPYTLTTGNNTSLVTGFDYSVYNAAYDDGILFNPNSTRAGLFTAVDGQLIDYFVNTNFSGPRTNGIYGGSFRLDTRGTNSSEFFTVRHWDNAGGTSPSVYLNMTQDSRMIIGPNVGTPLAQLHIDGGVGSLDTGIAIGNGNTGVYEVIDDEFAIQAGGVLGFKVDGATAPGFVSTIFNPDGAIGVNTGIRFGGSNTGFYQPNPSILSVLVDGVQQWTFSDDFFRSATQGGAGLLNEIPSAINPTVLPRWGDDNTGVGSPTTDQISIIAGGIEGIRVEEANNYVIYKYNWRVNIVASTIQSQGQQVLLSSRNRIDTVANANDVVTLPVADTGREVVIHNAGANTLQIFPNTGDDLGNGVNNSTTLAVGSTVTFEATDTTTWITK